MKRDLLVSALFFLVLFVGLILPRWARAQDSDQAVAARDAARRVIRADDFKPVPIVASGMCAPGTALFIPTGLDPAHLPASVALLKTPQIEGGLPAGWRVAPQFSTDGKRFRAVISAGPEVDFYGGGEVTGPLRRNGQSITLWNTDNFVYERAEGRRLYQSHPWMMGVRPDGSAFGVLFDSTWRAEMNCSNGVEFVSDGPAFPVLVIDRASPQEVLAALGELTGKMPLPPRWALGYQQCRWSYKTADRVKEIADGFRSRHIPCDVIWMDIDYMDGFRVFTFNPKTFPDPRGLNNYLHDHGFKSVWMIDPGVKFDSNYSVYQSGQAKDLFVKTAAGSEYHGKVWPGPCAFPDFTRPETRQWWSGLYADFMAHGVDGVWNDMNEPAVFDVPDHTMPEDNRHAGGDGLPAGPHLQYHNIYGMQMVRATREGIQAAHPDRRPFVLTRANFLGGQRYAATWTGDNESTERCLKLAVPMSLTLGLSGQPFSGPDLGGFAEDATPELWADWVGFGTFLPFCRGHACEGTKDKEPWAFGPATENTACIALQRRYRLLPYLYTLFEAAARTGVPVMRPVFFADPQDASLRSEQQAFLVGGDLLVVPRYAQNAHLPAQGKWPEVSLVPGDLADARQASVRIRPGAIVPLGRIVESTTEKSLDPLTLLVCLDESGHASGTLYEDAGDGYGFRTGDSVRTTYQAERKDGKVVVTVAATDGTRKSEGTEFQVQVVN